MRRNRLRPKHGDRVLLFFQSFLRHPKRLGSLIPSSRFLERRIARLAGLESGGTIVELGPGTGGTTRALLAAMPPWASLLSIEISPEFVAALRAIDDQRLLVHHGSAEQLTNILGHYDVGSVDAVVSGIPFSLLRPDSRRKVVDAIWSALAPGGRFIAYQVCRRVEVVARPRFGPAQVAVEFRNLPPLRVYAWRKVHA